VGEINVAVQLNEKNLAAEITKQLGPALAELLKTISATTEAQINERRTGQQKQANAQ
jgi:hypothetical protein